MKTPASKKFAYEEETRSLEKVKDHGNGSQVVSLEEIPKHGRYYT